jgi:hypothetical protein
MLGRHTLIFQLKTCTHYSYVSILNKRVIGKE